MASFISKILSAFSGTPGQTPSAALSAEPQIHAGCTIYAEPMREGGQYRLAGRIEQLVGDDLLTRNFIRADVFTSTDDALECTFRKARQIIDQNGPSLFSDGAKTRQV
ncbi:MAG: HlyU family transcriptional regulator [Allorhizobium sp.]